MPAPKLLPKKLVTASLAAERKQEIDKGIQIAKAVDAVREARAKEEVELETFRRETIAKVQLEINAVISERDMLAAEIPLLKAERIKAQAPINLKEEWQRVEEDKATNQAWQERNTQKEIDLLAREQDHSQATDALSKEREEIQEEHKLSLRTLKAADDKFAQADTALSQAETQAQGILKDAQQRENHLRVREEDATVREASLSARERKVDAHEIDLSNREHKLRVNQQTFIKAKAYINSKK